MFKKGYIITDEMRAKLRVPKPPRSDSHRANISLFRLGKPKSGNVYLYLNRGYINVITKIGSEVLHRSIMEDTLGRSLIGGRSGERVHHENGNKLDNRPNNLRLFDNQKEHLNYHKHCRQVRIIL